VKGTDDGRGMSRTRKAGRTGGERSGTEKKRQEATGEQNRKALSESREWGVTHRGDTYARQTRTRSDRTARAGPAWRSGSVTQMS